MFKSSIIGLVILIGWLQYQLWFASGSLAATMHLQTKISQQQAINQQYQQQNLQLTKQVIALRQNPAAIAAKAREELGMIKQGEVFYRIVPTHPKTQ